MLTLDITKRDKETRPQDLRTEGMLPAVFYGKGLDAVSISVKAADFKKVYDEAGESTVITLKGDGEEKNALIHEIDYHPVTDEPRHVDFYIVKKGQKVTVDVPLEFVGEAPAVKNLSGVLMKVLHDIEIEAEPANLPHSIEVDVTTLVDFDTHISIGDLKLPAGVVATGEADEVVALVSEAREVEEETQESTEIDMESIGSSDTKGKKDEEGEATEE